MRILAVFTYLSLVSCCIPLRTRKIQPHFLTWCFRARCWTQQRRPWWRRETKRLSPRNFNLKTQQTYPQTWLTTSSKHHQWYGLWKEFNWTSVQQIRNHYCCSDTTESEATPVSKEAPAIPTPVIAKASGDKVAEEEAAVNLQPPTEQVWCRLSVKKSFYEFWC